MPANDGTYAGPLYGSTYVLYEKRTLCWLACYVSAAGGFNTRLAAGQASGHRCIMIHVPNLKTSSGVVLWAFAFAEPALFVKRLRSASLS